VFTVVSLRTAPTSHHEGKYTSVIWGALVRERVGERGFAGDLDNLQPLEIIIYPTISLGYRAQVEQVEL